MADLVFKPGRLNADEQSYIVENIQTKTADEIAIALNRRPQQIRDFLKRVPSMKTEEVSANLKNGPIYKALEKQLNPEELKRFLFEYQGYVNQFQGEILHSEQIQIIDTIKFGILEERCLIEEKRMLDEIARIDLEIKKERLGNNDPARLDQLSHDLAVARQLQAKNSETYSKLNASKLNGMGKLNATRDKREDARNVAFKTSYKDWMRTIIEDVDKRRELGEYMEMMRISADKEYKRLSQPYKYADGMVDLPILNVDTINNLKDE